MPQTRRAKIALSPGAGSVEIEGEQLSGVRAVTVKGTPGEIPQLVVELLIFDLEVDGEMGVEIPRETHATLRRLGWTPPGT